jgi:hypothetical protein
MGYPFYFMQIYYANNIELLFGKRNYKSAGVLLATMVLHWHGGAKIAASQHS